MACEQCGTKSGGRRFCSPRCKWTWHNQNRVLPHNIRGTCEVCGAAFSRYEPPSRLVPGAARFCGRTCAGAWRSGKNHPAWSGGEKEDRDGYVLVWVGKEHPHNVRGYIRKHRLVMEKKIGRVLDRREVVHHRNGNVKDNRIANLKLYASQAQHKAEDIRERTRDRRGRLTTSRK